MDKRRYPKELFIIGFITNIFFRFFWLFIPGVILLIVGISVKSCLYIGITMLILDIIFSFIEQLRIRQAFLTESDNPDFKAFQDALSKEGDWKENMSEFCENKKSENESEINKDE